ncbi:EAL domain-containing protein [Marinomonas ostreistagni]|uniref:EAL domain-containing protein n=1 Tax=Marinomonas ostreistagni TaxID=359209 RepID=A0ABS0Z7H2_9GAMM|nr:EAL domain-containing protein [Marinomonas ostreistagni]MBJ7549615.1 EAL domain-containing protein [Marinomonas ostreistagni]
MFGNAKKTPSLLIVDDSPAILKLLHEATKDLGDVFFATNGKDAISVAKTKVPDVILLDIEMPDLDGYEVFRTIKAIPELQDVSILFVTGHDGQEHELKTLELGGVDYIQKPINIAVTRARVKNQLTLRQQHLHIKKNNHEMALLIKSLPAFVAYWDVHGRNVFCNDVEGLWFGVPAAQMIGKHLSAVLPGPAFEEASQLISGSTQAEEQSIDIVCRDDEFSRFGQLKIVPHTEGTLENGYLMLIHDITSRKKAEQSLIDEKERIRITLNSIGDAVIATDTHGIITFLNPIAENMTGWSLDKAIGEPIETVMPLIDSESGECMQNPIRVALAEERVVGMALNCALGTTVSNAIAVEDSAAPILSHDGQISGAIIVFHDVSEARAMAIKMTHLAQHDSLTNLPNRLLLRDRAQQSIKLHETTNQKLAMVMVDLDDFKAVNEVVGHEVGDMVLQQVAYELKKKLKLEGNLFRPGGDEFLILLSNLSSSIQVTRFINKLMSIFQSKWEAHGKTFKITVSVGVSVYPEDSLDLDELYRHSESALFSAKAAGKNQFKFYNQKLEKKLILKQQLEQSLHSDTDHQQFEVHYQPKINIHTGHIIGVEALVRWRNSDGELIPPSDFIPLCEESGLIIPLGEYVLTKSCEQAVLWREMGIEIVMAVNVSIIQFEDPQFLNSLVRILETSGISPNMLELELTESVLAKDINYARALIERIRDLGIKVALDDFGTGYSSLAYINGFPLDVLKIDQSFVRNMLRSKTDQTIIAAIIQMANGLNLKLVAEGVETQEHADELKEMGCTIMQGFFFSKPIPAKQVTAQLQSEILTAALD